MTRRRAPCIALLTDFGTRDWYVGMLKGGLLTRCPHIPLVDLTHDIPPQDVVAGAFTLSVTARWFPPGAVFLCVVDPGVGSHRPLLAAHANGQYFIGPDNGMLAPVLQVARTPTVIQLTQTRYWLKTVSRTFQGRDILAPVAAQVARGTPLRTLGVAVPRVQPLALPKPQRVGEKQSGCLLHIDAFGNLITNVPESALPRQAHLAKRTVRYKQRWARMVSSYADGRPHELIAMIGSLGFLELAIREGSAAWTFNAKRGDRVDVIIG